MKVKWWVEGIGCPFAQCGNPEHVLNIDDVDLADLNENERDNFIDNVVDDEMRRYGAYAAWEIIDAQ